MVEKALKDSTSGVYKNVSEPFLPKVEE